MARPAVLDERSTARPGPARPSVAHAAGAHPAARARPSLRQHTAALRVVLVGVVVTAVLTWAAAAASTRTETRLLRTQVRQAAAVLQLDSSTLERPLAQAAELAVTDPADFVRYASGLLSPGTGKGFASMSLWQLHEGRYLPIAGVGTPVVPASSELGVQAMLLRARAAHGLGVLGLLDQRPGALVYGFVALAGHGRVATVGVQPLPAHRIVRPSPGSPFSELDYAIYLGRHVDPSRLLLATTSRPLPTADSTQVTIPFGDSDLYLVASAVGWLGGSLAYWLPIALAVAGAVLTGAAALLVDRVVRRRREAERLAEEVTRLYGEQRGLAETLQQALLPDAPAAPAGLDVAVRYAPGTAGMEVGGDWYDVVPLGSGRLLAVVGDVSGRGVEAARVMAALRFGLRAYAAEDIPLATLVGKVAGLIDVDRDGHFATLLALAVDVAARRCEIVNAGHLPPLLVSGGVARYLDVPPAPPVGVAGATYQASVHVLPPAATVVAYTDGLVERRREGLDPGLEALAAVGAAHRGDLESLVGTVLRELAPAGGDDTAILALRWQS